jgi:hypothetical protein
MKIACLTLAFFIACTTLGTSSLASACSITVIEYSPLERNQATLSGDTVTKVAKRVVGPRTGEGNT